MDPELNAASACFCTACKPRMVFTILEDWRGQRRKREVREDNATETL